MSVTTVSVAYLFWGVSNVILRILLRPEKVGPPMTQDRFHLFLLFMIVSGNALFLLVLMLIADQVESDRFLNAATINALAIFHLMLGMFTPFIQANHTRLGERLQLVEVTFVYLLLLTQFMSAAYGTGTTLIYIFATKVLDIRIVYPEALTLQHRPNSTPLYQHRERHQRNIRGGVGGPSYKTPDVYQQ